MPRSIKRKQTHITPRPFLKWVGGKGQLLPVLLRQVKRAGGFSRYHEPFVGGGALFFELHRQGLLKKRAPSLLSDANERLIETYLGVRDNPERLIALLEEHKARHNKDYYYEVRGLVPQDPIERAARIIYLNKTCFNGLYRENSKGLFNVPMGRYKNPAICDEENLWAVSVALQSVELSSRPFETILEYAEPGDLVYFDPPYHPVSTTANFTSYNQKGFGENDQRALAEVFAELARRGVKAILSNSYTPLILDIYAPFKPQTVSAARAVNSRAEKRGAVAEVLVTTF